MPAQKKRERVCKCPKCCAHYGRVLRHTKTTQLRKNWTHERGCINRHQGFCHCNGVITEQMHREM